MWVGTQKPVLLLCIPSDSEEVIPMPHFARVKARAPFSCLLVEQLIPSLIPFRWSSEARWLCYTQLPYNSSVPSEGTTCRQSLVWNEPVLLTLSKNLIETKLEKECFKKSLHLQMLVTTAKKKKKREREDCVFNNTSYIFVLNWWLGITIEQSWVVSCPVVLSLSLFFLKFQICMSVFLYTMYTMWTAAS